MAPSREPNVARLRSLRTHPRAECIAVVSLSQGTAAQIVWLLEDDYQIQVADWLPLGFRAAVARHMTETHPLECCTRNCSKARAWGREMAVPVTVMATRLA